MCEKYNGWSNRETWCMGLWLMNDEGLYHASREMAEDGGDNLKDWWDQLEADYWDYPKEYEGIGKIVRDVGSIYRVEWGEIATALTEE